MKVATLWHASVRVAEPVQSTTDERSCSLGQIDAHNSILFSQLEQIEDPTEPAAEVVRRCDQKQLMALYKVGTFEDADDLLRKIAVARGKLRPGGVPIIEVCPGLLSCCSAWAEGVCCPGTA